MTIHNFWIDAEIDGYKSRLKGGPRAKTGGMDISIKIRDEGSIIEAYRIKCKVVGSDLNYPILEVEVFNRIGYRIDHFRRYR